MYRVPLATLTRILLSHTICATLRTGLPGRRRRTGRVGQRTAQHLRAANSAKLPQSRLNRTRFRAHPAGCLENKGLWKSVHADRSLQPAMTDLHWSHDGPQSATFRVRGRRRYIKRGSGRGSESGWGAMSSSTAKPPFAKPPCCSATSADNPYRVGTSADASAPPESRFKASGEIAVNLIGDAWRIPLPTR